MSPKTRPGPAPRVRIGTAGWIIPAGHRQQFPVQGSHLERYAHVLAAAEINSSFYRHHRHETYARWARSVPRGFRFAVKTPRALTEPGSLVLVEEVLERFLAEVSGLGSRLGVLLVQLAPKVAFDAPAARRLFARLRKGSAARIACEPRHASWGSDKADALLRAAGVARVAADPPRWPGGELPGGAAALAYFRMHGQPRTYFSEYSAAQLDLLADQLVRLAPHSRERWCILDNTAHGHALGNALALQRRLAG